MEINGPENSEKGPTLEYQKNLLKSHLLSLSDKEFFALIISVLWIVWLSSLFTVHLRNHSLSFIVSIVTLGIVVVVSMGYSPNFKILSRCSLFGLSCFCPYWAFHNHTYVYWEAPVIALWLLTACSSGYSSAEHIVILLLSAIVWLFTVLVIWRVASVEGYRETFLSDIRYSYNDGEIGSSQFSIIIVYYALEFICFSLLTFAITLRFKAEAIAGVLVLSLDSGAVINLFKNRNMSLHCMAESVPAILTKGILSNIRHQVVSLSNTSDPHHNLNEYAQNINDILASLPKQNVVDREIRIHGGHSSVPPYGSSIFAVDVVNSLFRGSRRVVEQHWLGPISDYTLRTAYYTWMRNLYKPISWHLFAPYWIFIMAACLINLIKRFVYAYMLLLYVNKYYKDVAIYADMISGLVGTGSSTVNNIKKSVDVHIDINGLGLTKRWIIVYLTFSGLVPIGLLLFTRIGSNGITSRKSLNRRDSMNYPFTLFIVFVVSDQALTFVQYILTELTLKAMIKPDIVFYMPHYINMMPLALILFCGVFMGNGDRPYITIFIATALAMVAMFLSFIHSINLLAFMVTLSLLKLQVHRHQIRVFSMSVADRLISQKSLYMNILKRHNGGKRHYIVPVE